jgi:CheY-like chemotaxis protein
MAEEKTLVLIVEDQKINRDILKGILHNDYEVLEATNGQEGLALIAEKPGIKAILLDLLMPVMDGYQFLAALAKTPYDLIPTIAVTGENDIESEQKILELGAWDFVSKPYQPMTLLTRLKYAISRSEYFQLGALLLDSVGIPAAVFLEEEGHVRLIRLSHDFASTIGALLPFDPDIDLLEQPFLSAKDKATLKEAFAAMRANKESLLFTLGNSPKVQVGLRYWGEKGGAYVLFGEFKVLK